MNVSTIKKSSVSLFIAAAFLAVSVALPFSVGAAPGKSEAAKTAKPDTQNIAQIAIANGNFDTLVTALTCTDLVTAVSGSKQLTVFAPTDAAFAAINLNPSNVCDQEGLANILTYHVMSGRHTSTSVLARDSYKMLNGSILAQSELKLNTPNISASNGVIHVINNVLIP